jgi:hypothetical protein
MPHPTPDRPEGSLTVDDEYERCRPGCPLCLGIATGITGAMRWQPTDAPNPFEQPVEVDRGVTV